MRTFPLIAVALLLVFWSPASADSPDCRTGSDAAYEQHHRKALPLLDNCLNSGITGQYRVSMLTARAQAHIGLRQYPLAMTDLREAIALDQTRDAWPWIIMSMAHREQKQYAEALDDLKEAEQRDEEGPGSGPRMAVSYHKGRALHDAGLFRAAIEAYTRGIPHQPEYIWAYYHRALSYEAVGDKIHAKRDLEKAAELLSKNPKEAPIVKKIKEYGLRARTRGKHRPR